MSEEWSDWKIHDGRGCPVPLGTVVRTIELCHVHGVHSGGENVASRTGGSWDWSNYPCCTKVLRYQFRKPRGMAILQSLIADLPETVGA